MKIFKIPKGTKCYTYDDNNKGHPITRISDIDWYVFDVNIIDLDENGFGERRTAIYKNGSNNDYVDLNHIDNSVVGNDWICAIDSDSYVLFIDD